MTRIRHLVVPIVLVALLAVVPQVPLDIPVVLSGPLDSPGTLGLLALCLVFAGVALTYDLLFGYTGLLSFGHALYFAIGVYVMAIALTQWELPLWQAFVLTAVVGIVVPLLLGAISLRVSGIAFAMVTLAFAQMLFFIANQWRSLTGGENGLQAIPRSFFGVELVETEPFYFYYAALPIVLAGMWVAWRIVHSPFGRVLVAIRDNPARARALGYDVQKYKLMAFVQSAGLAGVAGGLFSISHGFASLQELYWTTSGKVVLIAVLGGIGTLWGGPIGAALVILLEDYLASSGFEGIGIITGTVFVVVVLLFRRGIWGTGRQLLVRRRRRE